MSMTIKFNGLVLAGVAIGTVLPGCSLSVDTDKFT